MGSLEGMMAAPVRREGLQKDLEGRIRGLGVVGSAGRVWGAPRGQLSWENSRGQRPSCGCGCPKGREGAEGQRPGWNSGPV